MGIFVNQNSYLLLVVLIWLIAAYVLLRRERNQRQFVVLGAVTLFMAAGFFLLRLAPVADAPTENINARIGAGKPVLLEFRSQN